MKEDHHFELKWKNRKLDRELRAELKKLLGLQPSTKRLKKSYLLEVKPSTGDLSDYQLQVICLKRQWKWTASTAAIAMRGEEKIQQRWLLRLGLWVQRSSLDYRVIAETAPVSLTEVSGVSTSSKCSNFGVLQDTNLIDYFSTKRCLLKCWSSSMLFERLRPHLLFPRIRLAGWDNLCIPSISLESC